jgi:hypothetical protein
MDGMGEIEIKKLRLVSSTIRSRKRDAKDVAWHQAMCGLIIRITYRDGGYLIEWYYEVKKEL